MSAPGRLLMAGAILVLGAPATAQAAPTPEPDSPGVEATPEAAEGVPTEVTSWFRADGWEILASQAGDKIGLGTDEMDHAGMGLVRTVSTWSDAYVDGVSTNRAVVALEEWVAPITVDDAGAGVLRARLADDGEIQLVAVEPSPELAAAMPALAPDAPVVHDAVLDGWFTVEEDRVRPLDANARDSLAGTLTLEAYQPFVTERYLADEAPTSPETTASTWMPAAWAGGIAALLLAWAGVIVWLRRDGAR